ncbi:MAG: hypothetical protein Q9227_002856 [Pyrenula ochraceoflavens]
MNRFRTRRKGTDGDEASASGTTSGAIFSKGRKSKKRQGDDKPALDLTTALPSSDDFRTSLLMPNLSARFSMLREQDDPNSKLGKANDDSVLFPKRVSRLNVFNHSPSALHDIDEVASINSSIRPPFLTERSGSYASLDGYGTDDDGASVMNRSRPIEGNNLFGGRQKVYKIPHGTSSSRGPESPSTPKSPLPGRAVYESDVSTSHFQKTRTKDQEYEGKRSGSPLSHSHDVDHDDHDSVSSPYVGFSKNRGTQSSTASGPSNRRASTAATSIDSQTPANQSNRNSSNFAGSKGALPSNAGLDRNATIHRRLYGIAGDQNAGSQPTIPRQSSLSQSRSATQLHDRFQKNAPGPDSTMFRTTSPPPTTTPPGSAPQERGRADSKGQEGEKGHGYGYVPPLSPPISEGDEAATYMNSIQPEDRGKATALGLFNRPAKQYDDQQFLQRQIQLHEARSASPLPKPSAPPTSALPEIPSAARRNHSNSSTGSRSQSGRVSMHKESPKQKATDNLHEDLGVTGGRPPPVVTSSDATQGTFLEMVSPSDEEADQKPVDHRTSLSQQSAGRSEHSGSGRTRDRSSSVSSHQSLHEFSSVPISVPMRNHVDILEPIPSPTDDVAADSPTLGPGMGLSGLIRAHLRQDSDHSSIYPPRSPGLAPDQFSDSPAKDRSVPSLRAPNQTESMHSNPWEFEDAFRRHTKQPSITSPQADSAIPTLSSKAKQILGQATALKEQALEAHAVQSHSSSPEKNRSNSPNGQTWQEVLNAKHYRGGSTETEREREEFENELAERRRRVQEKLKSVAENSSRSNSPIPGAPKPGNAFSMLRQKTNRGPPLGQPEPQNKAMKMLGIGNATMSSSPNTQQGEMWKEEEERMLADFAKRPKPRSPHPPRSPHMPPSPHPPMTNQQSPIFPRSHRGYGPEQIDDSRDHVQRAQTPSSFKGSRRDRSSSDLSGGRSRSRNDRRGNEIADAFGRPRDMPPTFPPNISIPPRPSVEHAERRAYPYERSASAASGQYRSGSRPPPPQTGYFDKENLLPIQTHGPGVSPKPSPYLNAYSASSTPTVPDMSPSYSAASTPGWGHQEPPHNHPNTSRKRSVTKGMISEPTFLSSTSTLSTYGIRTGPSSAATGQFPQDNDSPPIPMMNPRRRRPTLTQTMINPGSRNEAYDAHPMPQSAVEVRSHFSDEGEKKPKRERQRLRKSSSEGGNLNAKARQHAMAAPSPALPAFPRHPRMHGGMI